MSRKPLINWRKSDTEKLETYIKRFNAKVYRTRKAHPELADIQPKPILKADKQKLIQEIKEKPRAEFNKQLRSMERYGRKGAEKAITSKNGITVSKWELKETKLKYNQIEREKARELKVVENMDVTSQGKKVNLKRAEMGDERVNELKPVDFRFDKVKTPIEWQKYKDYVDKRTDYANRMKLIESYKENYLKGLDEYGGYADDIKSLVNSLPADVVVDKFYSEQEASIDFYYEGIDGRQDPDTVLNIIRGVWTKAKAEYEKVNS
jgi:hypothetical protein